MKLVKTFSATQHAERNSLGDAASHWILKNGIDVHDVVVRQSSDNSYHCLSIAVVYIAKERRI